ncbi:Histidinol-phosphatase (alternative form) [Rubellimicrobium mesophilum DSM 19309]|uniref:Histidinol-phosphatase (Alternative form) n=1 Tax=Rubellimicrobium mesophilum DSM 19309 TaxID=442562 RepID=A0A017HRV9_9RHOB|nr:inositol monophosphatase family protein [Rubellimicrobium mesophilum]EYD76494.1 Histidinol-phosphatase (alternative form) [Rubellimicrobium mesophilum DSM 19309]
MRDTLSPDTRAHLIRTAQALADAARPETLRHFRTGIASDDKGPGPGGRFDPVTEADRAAERAMRAVLARERPQDGILGEEYGTLDGTSGLTWVLDPIDGTRGYISGTPTWGVLVAVSDAEGPLYGIIDQPYIGERFFGGLGEASVTGPLGTARLRTAPARPLAGATILTTFPEIGTEEEHRAFRRVADQARLVRYGMDCYGYALLAAGQVDLVIEAGLQPYDVQAPIAVVTAAGGIATGWDGRPAHGGGRLLAAANAEIHAAAMELLAGS